MEKPYRIIWLAPPNVRGFDTLDNRSFASQEDAETAAGNTLSSSECKYTKAIVVKAVSGAERSTIVKRMEVV